MKPEFCVAAVASILLPVVVATSAASREVDRAACDAKDAVACTRLIEDAAEAASIRSIAHGNRGTIYRDSGDDDHARADFKEAVRLDPGNVGIGLIHRCLALAKGFSDGMAVYGSGVAYQKARAQDMALRRCEIEQHHSVAACALVETACDEFADLPPGIVPDESKRCRIGMRADIKGTLLDIRRDKKAWFVGTATYVDTCSGLVDASTGFAVLRGSKPLPSGCRVGKRFVASGDIDYGFEPEFFLRVHSIECR